MAESCEEHRERLLRAARLGLGYVQVARDRGVPAPGLLSMRVDVATAHAAEIQAVIDGVVPHSEGVLARLGAQLREARDELRLALVEVGSGVADAVATRVCYILCAPGEPHHAKCDVAIDAAITAEKTDDHEGNDR